MPAVIEPTPLIEVILVSNNSMYLLIICIYDLFFSSKNFKVLIVCSKEKERYGESLPIEFLAAKITLSAVVLIMPQFFSLILMKHNYMK